MKNTSMKVFYLEIDKKSLCITIVDTNIIKEDNYHTLKFTLTIYKSLPLFNLIIIKNTKM